MNKKIKSLSSISFRAQQRISFILVFYLIANFAFAQTDPLTKKVTSVIAHKEPIESVLSSITKQTNVRFSYNSQLIDPKTKVSVNAQNKTVKEILTIILPPYISYKKVGEHIVFIAEEQKSRKAEKENSSSNNGNLPESCLDSVSLTKNDEMKTLFAELLIAATMAVAPVLAQDTLKATSDKLQVTSDELQVIEDLITSVEEKDSIVAENTPAPLVLKPFLFTFIYPLGTGWVKSPCNNYHASLSILGGVTGQTIGIDLGGLFNINTFAATGVQFAGLFNLTGSRCSDVQSRNAQFSGVFNITQKGKSAQFGGVFNIGDTAWVQASGVFNIAKFSWAQFAGIYNGGCNALLQAAGIANVACNTAFQAAGIVNVAEKSACQIAGIVNITKKGKFQMGMINVRDTADGVSLGLINIVKKGGVLEAGIEAGEFVHTALTFRSGVKRLYSIISVGYNYTEKFWSVGAGLGTSFRLIGNLGLNLELSHSQLYLYLSDTQSLSPQRWNSFCQFKPLLNYRFAKHFKIYAGPSFNLLIQNSDWVQAVIPSYEKPIKVPYSTYNRTDYNTILDMWIGVTGGIKF